MDQDQGRTRNKALRTDVIAGALSPCHLGSEEHSGLVAVVRPAPELDVLDR